MKHVEQKKLQYDEDIWFEKYPIPVKTLQLFITNRCNQKPRCRECFYQDNLNSSFGMSMEEYIEFLESNIQGIDVEKIILLGGEPTVHPLLKAFIGYNMGRGLKTTVYTNGLKLKVLEGLDFSSLSVRIGVHGVTSQDKPLNSVHMVDGVPATIVYMLRRDNVSELMEAAKIVEELGCEDFFISSIRDIRRTDNYWKDTSDTLPADEYFDVVQDFIDNYEGGIKRIHISRRGVIVPNNFSIFKNQCRFGNVFPDGKKIICPFDISKQIFSDQLFEKRQCNKHSECLLQKIVLERK